MDDGGVLEVYDNVFFEANTAGYSGGAVSRPSKIDSHLPGVATFWRCTTVWSLRGTWLSLVVAAR